MDFRKMKKMIGRNYFTLAVREPYQDHYLSAYSLDGAIILMLEDDCGRAVSAIDEDKFMMMSDEEINERLNTFIKCDYQNYN